MQTNPHTTEHATYKIEDGILFVIYNPNLIITGKIANEMVDERYKMRGGKKMPVIADIRNLVSVDNASRKCFASEKSTADVTACALVVDSLVSRMIGNIFIVVDRPKIPIRLFTDEIKAIKWLQKFL